MTNRDANSNGKAGPMTINPRLCAEKNIYGAHKLHYADITEDKVYKQASY